uniref:tRNA (guanine(9)-N(1))-methyltransferase n=1 Tax=Sinocyclocheilus rhinocerous TaxID=307959 RepID=A0A673LPA5_9TELE
MEEESGCCAEVVSKVNNDLLEFLRIDVELEPLCGREETTCSKNVMRKQRNWERRLEAKKSKRKEEKQRKKLNKQNKGDWVLIQHVNLPDDLTSDAKFYVNIYYVSLLALECVEEDKVYILGGLVDETIQKKISYTRAKELGVRTARLPIDEYMVKRPNPKNFHSKILAINQVFEILLTFRDIKDWTNALAAGIPPGKGYMVANITHYFP